MYTQFAEMANNGREWMGMRDAPNGPRTLQLPKHCGPSSRSFRSYRAHALAKRAILRVAVTGYSRNATKEATPLTKIEAERLAREIQRTPGWQTAGFYHLEALSKTATAHGVYALHQATSTVQQVFSRSAWAALQAKFPAR